jgi:hypothetical protein
MEVYVIPALWDISQMQKVYYLAPGAMPVHMLT